uniref:Translocated promoter region a, nuclear basket protein n=1 Tax=Salarias fasciatus TaxID=181472 RepID=A0A672I314_SALFA
MAAVLLQALERPELNKLPKGVQNKLEKFVTELQNANEALRTQHERFKADSEQQYFDIEKRLLGSQEQILSATKDLQTVKEENKKLKDVKRLNEKLTDANKVKMELQLKLDGIESSAASVQHREKRMEQEKELLEKKAEWLSAELKTKTEELLKTSREKGKEILELQGNLKISKEQVNRLESQLTSLKQINENQNKRAEDLNNKLKQLSAMDEKYRNELNAHVKLSSLYKVSQDKALSDLSLAYLIKLFSSICRTMSFSYCRGRQQRWRLRIKSSAERLKRSPRMFLSCFQLYNAYAECQTQLQLEKQETRRVSKVLDEIVQEVESKAPVLKRQREEYEGMQRSTASLFNKLEQARTEIYSLQKEKEEAKQQNEALQREKQRIETQLEDTSAQVCSLLVDLEEARGNRVSKNDGSSTDISSTSEVLSARQISFRSVEELQRQNQSLLGRLRELEEEKDRQKGQVTSARISELESSMAKLKTEMELLREQRNQQKQLSDSNARQRDMYKALLTQSTGFSLFLSVCAGQDSSASAAPVRPSVPATRSTPQRAAAAESAQTAQAKAALKQLNDAFTLYKKEKAENDRMLNETNDRLQRQLTEFRSSHAKLTSQLEFSNKRYEMLQETVNAYRREISALQERNQKMAATAQRHEHIIHTMSQDLRQTNEKLALEEVRVENLSKERDLLRQAESRLNREKEAMLAEQRNQNLLLTNLKSIQLTMERTDTETRQRLNNKIEKLEAELSSMKTRMDQEIAQRHALGRTMDAQLLEAKKQLETQNTLQQKTRELLRTSEQQVASLKAQLAAASSSEAAQSSQSEQELSEVKGLLRAAEEQNNELTEQLKNTNATVQQYRSVVLTLEDSLKKEKESRSPLELRVKESEELQKQLEKRILEVEKMKQQEEEERRKAMDAVEKQVSELQRSLKSSQTEQQEALERAAAAVTLEQKAIQESLLQTKLAGEAQSKYERELMLHAADVEALQELKKKFQQDTTRKRELEEQLKKTSALLQEKTAAWNAAEKKMKDQANQNRRCEELGKQNALLHQQMDELATKSRQLQQQQHQQQLDLSFSEEGKTTEQILEILRFVRREKEIAETRCEASDKEALRYKQRVEHQDREIKELHEALNVERERMQATVKTLAQQEEQLKKMETISALQENNRMLKMDRDKLEQELNQAQVKVRTPLSLYISPLHHSLSQLSEKNGSLQADRRLLEEDLKRWKARAQQLMSQQKDGDTEERQKLIAEKEAHLRRITNLAEETGKLKTELARANATSNLAQTQVQGLKDAIARLTSERDSLKKEVENSNNVILEKNKTITQVKKIGRRYKTQFDELKAQHDKVWSSSWMQVWSSWVRRETATSVCLCGLNLRMKSIVVFRLVRIIDLIVLLQLSETKSREEQLKQQMSDKEEKTKKVFMGAKTKINQLNKKLSQEIEELKQSKEELEVRMNALKSQYEGRLLRQDRELRELRETQTHSEPREEPQDQSGAKVRTRPADPRQMSLKSPAQDRGSSSLSEPPTANIRPTPSTPSPSNKPSPSPGSKATPRASIRPMVTPAPVPVPTPTATVMPTTQTDSQEGKSENSQPLMSAGGSVHSTSSGIVNAPASLNQPTSSQATAFVQPTQQQIASQDAASSVDSERPSTSSSLPATGEMCLQLLKKFRKCIKCLISQINLPEEGFPMLAEDEEEEGVSQSVPSDQMSSQESALIRDVIVIDTDSESQESKEEPIQEAEGEEEEEEEEEEGEEEEEEEEEGEEEDDNDDDAADSGLRGEESNEESREAQDDEEEEEEPTEGGNNAEDGSGVASSDQQRPSESAHGGEPPLNSEATPDSDAPRDSVHFPPTSTSSLAPSPSSSSLTPRLPHTRRPPHALPPRLYIQPPAPELGPPQSSQLRRPSAGRGPQLTPGIGTMQPFFDDDDRMVPSTPTLVVPHRTDGFAEAIHSPQVAGLSTRFRFGPPEDLLPQTSASHSDLGQLASQGGLGMYESPLFLPAHDEDGGGRSVPTTPLQVAAPVTVFTESLPSDSTDNMASQSVPMVTASSGMAAAADDGDEVFMEHEGDGIESSLDSQTDMESTGQQSDDASLPSTSQVPGNLIYPDFISCLKCRNLYF